MRIGLNITGARNTTSIDGLIEEVRTAHELGFPSVWTAQIFGWDALTALAVAGREVPDIELGTAVVPTYPRHPMMLAGQALTTQAAITPPGGAGRLTLGIGLSHQIVVEHMWGYSYARPARHMTEYLEALLPLLHGQPAAVSGEMLTCHGGLDQRNVPPPQVLVAALGPRMLELTGAAGCGTITWCTGPRTLASHIVPGITAAATAAGQPAPRVVAGIPVVVTADEAGTRAALAEQLVVYGGLPSYRAMLDLEGVDGPADIAIIGDEDTVADAVRALADTGVTDLGAVVATASAEDADRTRRLLAHLATN